MYLKLNLTTDWRSTIGANKKSRSYYSFKWNIRHCRMWNNFLTKIVKYLTYVLQWSDVCHKMWRSHTSLGVADIIGNANIICRRQTSLKKALANCKCFFLAPPAGLEPATSWLTVMRSTDWAKEEYLKGYVSYPYVSAMTYFSGPSPAKYFRHCKA